MKNTNNISEIANLIILNMTCDEKMDLPMIEEGLSRAYLLGYNKAQAEYKDAMTLNEYQAKAMMTCMPSCHNLSYMLLNLVGEVGEFSSKIAKGIRKENLIIKENDLFGYDDLLDKKELEDIIKELGDILWQLSGVCHIMNLDLEGIAKINLAKLASRKERGCIEGDGDNR